MSLLHDTIVCSFPAKEQPVDQNLLAYVDLTGAS